MVQELILEVLYLVPGCSQCFQSPGKLFESYRQSILVIAAEPKKYRLYSAAAFQMSWKGYAEDVERFKGSEKR